MSVLVVPPVLADLFVWLDSVERDVVHFVTCRLYHPWLDPVFLGVQSKVVGVSLMIALLVVLAVRRPRRALRATIACGAAFGVAMTLASLLWATVDRSRPPSAYERVLVTPEELAACAEYPEALPLRMDRAVSPSFPSRHGLTIGVFVTVVWLAWRRAGYLAILYGLVTAVGRVYAGKHWPTDVLVGVAVGALLGWLAWRVVPKAFDVVGRGEWVRDPTPDGEATGR